MMRFSGSRAPLFAPLPRGNLLGAGVVVEMLDVDPFVLNILLILKKSTVTNQ